MAETRLEKYRRYRESLNEVKANNQSEDAQVVRRSKVVTDTTNTTSTLPLEEVLGKIDQESEESSYRVQTFKLVRLCLLIMLGVLLIAGIVIFAVVAFGGNKA